MGAEPYEILLIDDDQDMHFAVRAMLSPPRYHITACSTGPAGFEALKRKRPDIVLLDIMLATPSEGFHLCYAIKEDPQTRDIPVIMISAIGSKIGMDYAKELGSEYVPADAFLEKPLDAAVLRVAVDKFLGIRA